MQTFLRAASGQAKMQERKMSDKPTTSELVKGLRNTCAAQSGKVTGVVYAKTDDLLDAADILEAKAADCAALQKALMEIADHGVPIKDVRPLARKARAAHPAGKEMLERMERLKGRLRRFVEDAIPWIEDSPNWVNGVHKKTMLAKAKELTGEKP